MTSGICCMGWMTAIEACRMWSVLNETWPEASGAWKGVRQGDNGCGSNHVPETWKGQAGEVISSEPG